MWEWRLASIFSSHLHEGFQMTNLQSVSIKETNLLEKDFFTRRPFCTENNVNIHYTRTKYRLKYF